MAEVTGTPLLPSEAAATVLLRAFHPSADRAAAIAGGAEVELARADRRGLFTGRLPDAAGGYRIRFGAGDDEWEVDDPYAFPPTLGELDLHLIGEGTHRQLWRRLGARVMEHQGATGVAFAVWAPNARGVRLVSDATFWDDRVHFMRSLGASGVWEIFVPGMGAGARYKYEVIDAAGRRVLKADPLARATEPPPASASIVEQSHHAWADGAWLAARRDVLAGPVSIYEVHLGSWRRGEGGRTLGYREVGPLLAAYCREMGFTHVELMPLAEHPFGGSWGYQVSSYFAPTARFGAPDDLRWMVDHLHQNGIGVLLDWVPAHFPRDEWALARFDGTALYEHADPRLGEHPDWGTLVFNYGRNEVRNFLVANARYWIEEFHVDGLRVDAVASMLYLDYSRKPGQWVPNAHGGRENLEAVRLLREVNATVAADYPGVLTVAEESTAWPGVSRPLDQGGLGFSAKWNMGWMHDTLGYFRHDPVYRRFHHHELTFGLVYAWSESFILPLSHDEVVHGKGSLLGKMPGDPWRRFANLRALLAWMWAHPGKQLLFMGGEIAQEREWSHDRSLDWHLLDLTAAAGGGAPHRGVQDLVRDLNARYRETPALWRRDFTPEGFRWIDAGNADQNVIAFLRLGDAVATTGSGGPGASGVTHPADQDSPRPEVMACVANLSPMVREGFRVGLPHGGRWREVLNTDAEAYGGGNVGNLGGVDAEAVAFHGMDFSAVMTLPPLAVLWLAPEEPAPGAAEPTRRRRRPT
ncbi:MAG TPA: 1,4-alpha-glucan branching protein GlgB [Candidatus Dormibacteraeota bacterium]|nr:1,4-alpha-glucan branching protein GlgB [Candidatus Dormibacteraeota bacterium]